MWTIIAILIVCAIATVLILAAMKPNIFRLERQAVIRAAPDTILGYITDFRKWTQWSPWEGLDPAMKRTYSGAERGEGAVYAWESKGKAGAGRMELTAVAPGSVAVIKLDFLKPFEAHNTSEFTLVPNGDGTTTVIWAMFGPSPYLSKVMHTVMNMDAMVGKDFEKGLQNLRTLSEAPQT